MPGRNIVIAIDASAHSKYAFEWCLSNIYRQDDTLIICHIPETPHLPAFSFKDGLGLPVEEWQKAIQGQLEKVKTLEDDYSAELLGKKMKFKFVTDTNKRPGEGIIKVAEREKADTVVMGTRGLDVMRRTLLGSVSDYVVRHSSVPVVVCPDIKE